LVARVKDQQLGHELWRSIAERREALVEGRCGPVEQRRHELIIGTRRPGLARGCRRHVAGDRVSGINVEPPSVDLGSLIRMAGLVEEYSERLVSDSIVRSLIDRPPQTHGCRIQLPQASLADTEVVPRFGPRGIDRNRALVRGDGLDGALLRCKHVAEVDPGVRVTRRRSEGPSEEFDPAPVPTQLELQYAEKIEGIAILGAPAQDCLV